MTSLIVEIGALIVAVVLFYILFRLLKPFINLVLNSVAGIFIFFLLNTFFGLTIPINVFSIGIVAIAGIPGVVLVLILHFFGLAF